jgi:hypothetical protein
MNYELRPLPAVDRWSGQGYAELPATDRVEVAGNDSLRRSGVAADA